MKKYLFLLFLFLIYLFLTFQNKESYVLSYNDKNDSSVIDISMLFDNKISSNKLKEVLNKFNGEYFIYEINSYNNRYKLSCEKIDKCINDIYNQEDFYFKEKYITSGFIIKEVKLLGYKNDIIPFLNENNFNYKIN